MITVPEELTQSVKKFIQDENKVTDLAVELCSNEVMQEAMDGMHSVLFNLKGDCSTEPEDVDDSLAYTYDKKWVEEIKVSHDLLASEVFNGELRERLQFMLQEDIEEQLLELL